MDSRVFMHSRRILLHVAAVAAFAATGDAWADTKWVANYGLDGTGCGALATPCRSISQAMENAIAGDTIMVRAGRYGDLNRDQDFDDPGEEHPDATDICVVCIRKPLRILSESGPTTTLIDGAGGERPLFARVVLVAADNVLFGDDGKGFTLTGGLYGLVVSSTRSLASVRIAENVAIDNPGTGFYAATGAVKFERNTAVRSITGFHADDHPRITLLTYLNNVATENIGSGFNLGGQRAIVSGNVAVRNTGPGFVLHVPDVRVENNTAAHNGDQGFLILPSNPPSFEHAPTFVSSFRQNTLIGNGFDGLLVSNPVSFGALEHNNFIGNGVGVPPNDRCGIRNESLTRIDASRNYWGQATGPGPAPADPVGGDCDAERSTTIATPFATEQFTIRP
jgi:hypothetical protein